MPFVHPYHPWMPWNYYGDSAADTIADRFRKPISVNQLPGGGPNYPFVNPSSDIALLLGDLYLSYQDDDSSYSPSFSVGWMYGFGDNAVAPPPGWPEPSHEYDMVIVDGNGQTVFDTTTATLFQVSSWGDGRYITITWADDRHVLRVTRYNGWPDYLDPAPHTNYIVPQRGELTARAYTRQPRQVRSLRVGLQRFAATDVALTPGYNVAVSTAPADNQLQLGEQPASDGGRARTPVTISAVPGSGLGIYSDCDSASDVIRRINNVAATENGDLTIDFEGCYRAQRPTTVTNTFPRQVAITQPAALQVFNDCGPCCECDDFVRTYEGVRRVWTHYQTLGQRAEAVRDLYAKNRERWLMQKDCRMNRPGRFFTVQEFMCQFSLVATFCNMYLCCLQPLILRFTFQTYHNGILVPDPVIIFPQNEIRRRGTDTHGQTIRTSFDGSYPIYDMVFDYANPQDTSGMTARVQLVDCTENHQVKVTMTAHAPQPSSTPERECSVLPQATVPQDILDIWAAQNRMPANPAIILMTATQTTDPWIAT